MTLYQQALTFITNNVFIIIQKSEKVFGHAFAKRLGKSLWPIARRAGAKLAKTKTVVYGMPAEGVYPGTLEQFMAAMRLSDRYYGQVPESDVAKKVEFPGTGPADYDNQLKDLDVTFNGRFPPRLKDYSHD